MKQLKKAIFAAFVTGLLFSITAISASAATYGDFTYNILDDGTVEITDYSGDTTSKLVIPDTMDGMLVTSIGDVSFQSCESLSSVIISEGISSIGFAAFDGCTNLTSVSIPGSVTSIGDCAFNYCTNLSSVTIAEGLKSIGNQTFQCCESLVSISLPNSLEGIGEGAFNCCWNLSSLVIPGNVSYIGKKPWSFCDSLSSLTIDTNNQFYCIVNDALLSKDKTQLICYVGDGESSTYEISTGITTICDYAFEGYSNLSKLTIPNTVTTLGIWIVANCHCLTSLTIPASVTSIDTETFGGCTTLTSIQISSSNPVYCMSDGILFSKDMSELICYFGWNNRKSYEIPETVTSIGNNAFDMAELTNITIPDSVTFIGDSAFSGSEITSIIIPDSVTYIGVYAFNYCPNLKDVTISSSMTAIPQGCFCNSNSLTSVVIPSGITTISEDAFGLCSNLESIAIPGSVESIGASAFRSASSLEDVYFGGSEEAWSEMDISSWDNSRLLSATVHYNSDIYAMPTENLVDATQYVPYSNQIASGGTIASGSLPKGLGLFSDGTISGIPTQTGIFSFIVDGIEYIITVVESSTTTVEAQNNFDIIEYVPEITSNAVDQIYHIDGPYADFLAFYINGTKMIEDVEFVAEEGSTVITIFAQTFATESTGTHTISATFATDDSTVAQVSQQVTKTAEQVANTMPYTDVLESAWYYDYVYLMYRRGIIAGTSTTTYSPTSNLTRGMMVDALYQLAGAPVATASSFTDVSADAWYADAVSWAAEVGVTLGVGDNLFAPDSAITREQMATMIQRYCDLMGITLPLYTSASPTDLATISDWAVDSATAMYQYGVLNGDEAGNFNPSGTATRAEAASMFSNFLEILDRT